jgi:hypothetical protein
MDAVDKLELLLERLLDQTEADQVVWTAVSDDYYTLEAKSGTMILRASPSGIILSIVSSEGNEVASAVAVQPFREQMDYLVGQLYDAVRRKTLGIDKTLDALLQEFGGEDASTSPSS